MQPTKQRQHTSIAALAVMALGWALLGSAAQAQTSNPGTAPLTLQALFEQAWQRQPEAQSAALRREAVQATRSVAAAWTAEPVALELSTKTDRPGSNQGSREAEVGLALPLWLPGERARKAALADSLRALGSLQRLIGGALRRGGGVRGARDARKLWRALPCPTRRLHSLVRPPRATPPPQRAGATRQ